MIGLRCHDKPHGGQSFGTSDSTTTVTNGPVLGLDTPVQWTKNRESREAMAMRKVSLYKTGTPFESGDLERVF